MMTSLCALNSETSYWHRGVARPLGQKNCSVGASVCYTPICDQIGSQGTLQRPSRHPKAEGHVAKTGISLEDCCSLFFLCREWVVDSSGQGEMPSTTLSAWPMANCPISLERVPQAMCQNERQDHGL